MKLAVVTGTSRGLGQALAAGLRSEGWHVAGLARTVASPHDIAADLRRPEAIAPAFDAAVNGIGPTRITQLLVVHNAGTVEPIGATAALDSAAIAAAVHLNLTAGMLLFAAAMARFQSLPGRKLLAQVSSGAALRAHAGLSVYCAAKAGLEHHLRVLALEQSSQPHPFLPVVLDPGAMDTGMQAALRAAAPQPSGAVADAAQRQQQGALAAPADVAHTLVALLQSPHLTAGQRYHVRDGVPR